MTYVDGLQVAEAAQELDLSVQRIRALLASGVLRGDKVAGRWFVDAESIERWRHRRDARGRPLSANNAWAVLFAFSGREPDWLSPWDKSRLGKRLAEDWRCLIPRLQNRAEVRTFYVHPSQISRMSSDRRLVLGGISAGKSGGSKVIGHDELEAYVRESDLARVISRYKLAKSGRPNVVLHVVSGRWPFRQGARSAPPAVVAMDLIESGDPRSMREGKSLMRSSLRERV